MATRKPASSPNSKAKSSLATTASYQHSEAKALIRPEAGAQTRFKKKKPTASWLYDSSLAPELQWDAQNPARELGEARIAALQAAMAAMQATLVDVQSQLAAAQPSQSAAELSTLLLQTRAKLSTLQNEPLRSGREAAAALKSMSRPFLNWAGKAERLSFDVPTLPMFIHERLSTQAILDSVSRHKLSAQGDWVNEFFGHPERSLPEQLMKAYEHPNGWQNRMVLGDSLVVMNSMLHYENMGGQVQMAYIDPPYGVKFGSNFQPFVRKRDVTHNDDEGLTREPEMVKAYRDTWELGLHSYLTYLRDRLLLTRELLAESGSVFVQISDENLHHVREVMDEVFGAENFVAVIAVQKTGSQVGQLLGITLDYLIWYAKNKPVVKYHQLPSRNCLKQRSLSGIVRPSQNHMPSNNELHIAKPLEVLERYQADHCAPSSFLTTISSLPRSSITFTAICRCWPTLNGVDVSPAKCAQTDSSKSALSARFKLSQACVRGKNAWQTRNTRPL